MRQTLLNTFKSHSDFDIVDLKCFVLKWILTRNYRMCTVYSHHSWKELM